MTNSSTPLNVLVPHFCEVLLEPKPNSSQTETTRPDLSMTRAFTSGCHFRSLLPSLRHHVVIARSRRFVPASTSQSFQSLVSQALRCSPPLSTITAHPVDTSRHIHTAELHASDHPSGKLSVVTCCKRKRTPQHGEELNVGLCETSSGTNMKQNARRWDCAVVFCAFPWERL